MNKTVLIFLALGWILAGCAGVSLLPRDGEMFGLMGVLSVPGCTPYAGPVPTCSGDKNDPKVMINLDSDPFEIVPKCVNAKKGKTIRITLISSSPIEEESVVIFPKDPENYPWLARSNSPDPKKIKIKVPTKKKSGDDFPIGDYDYGIWIAAQCLDPRVKVEN